MDRSTVVYLIGHTYTEDAYGVLQPTQTRSKVYTNVTSVSASEWYEGGRNGLNPEYRVRMFKYDYHGEDVLELNGKQYAIYRRYEDRGDVLDLYVERRKGQEAAAATENING